MLADLLKTKIRLSYSASIALHSKKINNYTSLFGIYLTLKLHHTSLIAATGFMQTYK